MMLGKRTTRGSNRHQHVSSVTDVIAQQNFHQSHFKLRFKLHVKCTTKKQTNPSHDIKVSSCPFSAPELEDLPRKISAESLKEKVRSVVTSDLFTIKYNDVEFDEVRSVVGWAGKRKTINDDPKSSLKNKACIELSSDKICKSHFATYGTKYIYISERDREKYILVDIGIGVYKKKDASTSASISIRPRKYKPIRDGCIPTLQDWKGRKNACFE